MDYSGAVLVARDGKPIFTAARGFADKDAKTLNTLDTRFRIASVTKPLTATAVLQLVQAGKVKLDAPIGTYIKDYPNRDFASHVTVHQLLTHTSGAGDIFGPRDDATRIKLKSLAEYVAYYGPRGSDFPPGEGFRYSNYGYIVLGRLIEEVTGQSYPDYMRDHVFKPAGMTRSGFEPESIPVEGRAKGYIWEPDGFHSNIDVSPAGATSSGGAYSTVEDMLAFAIALQSGKLLDAKHVELLVTEKTSTGYAYGFSDLSDGGVRTIEHTGAIPGGTAAFTIVDDGKVVIVALSNENPPLQPGAIMAMIHRRIKVMTADGKVAQFVRAPGGLRAPTEEQRVAAFNTADTDHDGKLDREGFRAALKSLGFADQLHSLFPRYDADRDGTISIDEIRLTPG
jgi:D-alanyl-D-alanine carboxypeptidase